MKLGSLEYLEEAKKRSNGDPEYLELSKGSNDSYMLVLEPEPDRVVTQEIVVGFDNVDGKMNGVWEGHRPTQFTLSAPYGVWVDILRGEVGPTQAIAMRKIRTRGPFLELLLAAKRVVRWVEILRTIPTEFEGNYAQYNLPGE